MTAVLPTVLPRTGGGGWSMVLPIAALLVGVGFAMTRRVDRWDGS